MNYWMVKQETSSLPNLSLMVNGKDLEINFFPLDLVSVKWRCRHYHFSWTRMENIFPKFNSFSAVNVKTAFCKLMFVFILMNLAIIFYSGDKNEDIDL